MSSELRVIVSIDVFEGQTKTLLGHEQMKFDSQDPHTVHIGDAVEGMLYRSVKQARAAQTKEDDSECGHGH